MDARLVFNFLRQPSNAKPAAFTTCIQQRVVLTLRYLLAYSFGCVEMLLATGCSSESQKPTVSHCRGVRWRAQLIWASIDFAGLLKQRNAQDQLLNLPGVSTFELEWTTTTSISFDELARVHVRMSDPLALSAVWSTADALEDKTSNLSESNSTYD